MLMLSLPLGEWTLLSARNTITGHVIKLNCLDRLNFSILKEICCEP
jgi:hypothetical protein